MAEPQPAEMPDPKVEDPELLPGGPDALDGPEYGLRPDNPVPRDLDPESNPAVDDVAPPEVIEPDDKKQEPDEGVSGGDTPDEPPA